MMLARMVWRDLRGRPMDTALLVLLVALSVLLATASTGLIATVGGASDRLLQRADSPHVVQMHAGELDAEAIAAWAAARPEVLAQQTVPLLTLAGDRLSLDGLPQTDNVQQNSLMVPSAQRDLLLRLDGTPLTEVEPGTVWLPVFYAIEEGILEGSTVGIDGAGGFRLELLVAGFHRDPIMNTAIASSKRLAVNERDFALARAHTGETEHLIEFWLSDPAQAAAFSAAYLEAGLPSLGPTVDRTTFRLLTMIGEGLDAGVVILASLLLLLVGLLCLRLSILTALQRELREIGVLKAIGIPAAAVRRMQLLKYGTIGAAACLLGLVGGLALLPVMTSSLTAYMGPSGSAASLTVPLVTALAIFLLLLLFILLLLRRIDRITAVQALQAAAAPPRRGRPLLGLHRSRRSPVAVRLGLVALLRRLGTSCLLAVVFAVATFIVIVPLSAALTIRAPSFTSYMGIPDADLRIDLPAAALEDGLDEEVARLLRQTASVERFVVHTAVRAELPGEGGLPLSVFVENGDHGSMPLAYAEGRAPLEAGEIALSLVALAESGLAVGQSTTLRSGEVVRDLRVVGAYQDITNGGRTARAMLPTEQADVVWQVLSVALQDGADPAAEAQRLASLLPQGRVALVDAYRAQTLGPVAERIGGSALLAALVALALAALVTAMTTRMVLASDAGQIAVQRAIGMPDASLRAQYTTQVLTALLLAVPLGALAAATIGQGMFNLLFEGLYGGFELLGRGTSRIEFVSRPLLTLGALPLALALAAAAATVAACRDIRSMGIRTVVAE